MRDFLMALQQSSAARQVPLSTFLALRCCCTVLRALIDGSEMQPSREALLGVVDPLRGCRYPWFIEWALARRKEAQQSIRQQLHQHRGCSQCRRHHAIFRFECETFKQLNERLAAVEAELGAIDLHGTALMLFHKDKY